jgi:hypothetical protein
MVRDHFEERVCAGCGADEQVGHLEICGICQRFFCPDCAHKAGFGRRFCSPVCARAYYFAGEFDDDQDSEPE